MQSFTAIKDSKWSNVMRQMQSFQKSNLFVIIRLNITMMIEYLLHLDDVFKSLYGQVGKSVGFLTHGHAMQEVGGSNPGMAL